MEDLDRDAPLRVASANVHSKVFDDEVVVLEMKTGTYFSLRGSAVAVWKLVEENVSAAGIADALASSYDAPRAEIATAVDALVDELAEAGLIVTDSAIEPGGTTGHLDGKGQFPAPEIERFTDMQELLLLDPIHEVDETGWPHTPAAS